MRSFASEFETCAEQEVYEAEASDAVVAASIGTDERRMHVRAYNYWVSLLEGRDFPSIEDLEPGEVRDFADHSVLLDFTCGRENPALPYIGSGIRAECELDEDVRTIADVPSRSLLSRLTDHYMQIIANRAPVGFEAEFANPRGETLCYRGILMPFSSDGDTIDFIYGVINWKSGTAAPAARPLMSVVAEAIDEAAVEEVGAPLLAPASSELPPQAGLADRLSAARETADAVKAGEGRTRAALYQALSLAYDFALSAMDDPEGYAELLADSGVKAQARAPMTPVAKLVFGIDYDKARLTEFAAALSHGQRQGVACGQFLGFIEGTPGGLKALVSAEREARRPEAKADSKAEIARARLRLSPPISVADIASSSEFAVVITRRNADGQHEPVAVIEDEALIERAIRAAA